MLLLKTSKISIVCNVVNLENVQTKNGNENKQG